MFATSSTLAVSRANRSYNEFQRIVKEWQWPVQCAFGHSSNYVLFLLHLLIVYSNLLFFFFYYLMRRIVYCSFPCRLANGKKKFREIENSAHDRPSGSSNGQFFSRPHSWLGNYHSHFSSRDKTFLRRVFRMWWNAHCVTEIRKMTKWFSMHGHASFLIFNCLINLTCLCYEYSDSKFNLNVLISRNDSIMFTHWMLDTCSGGDGRRTCRFITTIRSSSAFRTHIHSETNEKRADGCVYWFFVCVLAVMHFIIS